MSEIIYSFTNENAMIDSIDDHVRWLSVDEYSIFKKHLALCGQKNYRRVYGINYTRMAICMLVFLLMI